MKFKTSIATSITVIALSTAVLPVNASQVHYGTGMVTAIDNKAKMVKLKHGPIKSIGWTGMQMFFDVDNMYLLDEVVVGDKVEFDFIETRDKRYVITYIEAQ
ncbi:MAG: copper-binding protein [Gammaproteobacteria bacterium]|nr:copper-binding protein [Gammaproteobacteria bacterium]